MARLSPREYSGVVGTVVGVAAGACGAAVVLNDDHGVAAPRHREASGAVASSSTTNCSSQVEQRLLQVADFWFADRHTLNEVHELVAKGTSHLKYWTFPICAAVLYMPPWAQATTGQDVITASTAKELQLVYLRGVSAQAFRDSTTQIIQSNGLLTPGVASALERFNRLYRDVKTGDKYALSFDPKSDLVQLRLNDKMLGGVSGAEFSEALFSVWFGDKPFMERLKHDLLSGS